MKKGRILDRIVRNSHVPASGWAEKSREERNAEILMALARGIDELEPTDEKEMSRRARAVEALIAGAKALRGEWHENAGKRWDEQETERLREVLWAGMSLSEMAKLLGRSERAVWMKLDQLRPEKPARIEKRDAVESVWKRMKGD